MCAKTGFNACHSSFNFRAARCDRSLVRRFNVGRHRYVAPMASFLRRKFGDRLTIVLGGDSRLTVRRYFRSTAALSCDLTLVDGQFARVTLQPHNTIIIDDINDRRVRTA